MLPYAYHVLGQNKPVNYGYALVQNYTSKNYPAENINLAATQDEIGNMYFANLAGVLKFDGNYWTLIPTAKEAISVCYDSLTKTVYVGCVEDFGYIKIESSGRLTYQSLISKIAKKEKIGSVWDCIATQEGIYFNAQSILVRYKDGQCKFWESKSDFHSIFYAGGKLFIKETGVGLLCLMKDNLQLIKGSAFFSDKTTVYIGKIKSKPNDFILASRDHGLFTFNFQIADSAFITEIKPLNVNSSNFFKEIALYKGVKLKENFIAFGTKLGGLIIIDEQGNLLNQLNSKNGLNCDFINNVFEDYQGNLWLSTDNGISLVMHSLPITNFMNIGNVDGIVESFAKINNIIFIGTSAGIFKFNTTINQFQKINFPPIQVWQLSKIEHENALFAATSKGIYKIDANGNSSLASNEIEVVFSITPSKLNKNIYYVGHENGFATFQYQNGKLSLLDKLSSINYEVRAILEDNSGKLWLSTKYNGIICLFNFNQLLTNKLYGANFVTFNIANGLPSLNDNFVFEHHNKIIVATGDGVYYLAADKKYESYTMNEFSKLKFVRDSNFEPYLNHEAHQIYKMKFDEKNNAWVLVFLPDLVKYDIGVFENNDNKVAFSNKPFKLISKERINEFYIDSNYIWFGGSDLIYCYNKSKKYNFGQSYNSIINSVVSNSDTIFSGNYYINNNKGDSIINQISLTQPKELKKSFSYQNNDFSFQFSATYFVVDNPTQFSCFLEGEDEKWSEWSNETFKTYMNLYEGNYVFKVKAKNIFGTESTIATYEFTILPPWYRTTLAYIIYFILAFGFVYAVVNIYTRNLNRIIKNQTAELQKQKDEIEHKNKEITDSIYYAKRIQDAIMPSNEYIKNMFMDSFVFFKPKDIVSGDFYWANLRENNAILTAVDCTGHGVPGAFMSMMGNDYLSDIIVDSKVNDPAEILNRLRSGIIKALKQRGESGESKDGMDMSLVNINKDNLVLEYAGANNPIYIVRNKNNPEIANSIVYSEDKVNQCLYEIKGNKFPVGIHMGTTLQPFTKHQIQLLKGDVIYLFSDGFADQFGGPSGKKLKYNQFKKFILESMFLTMEEQKIYLEQKLLEWQGELEQVDDVLVIGVRIV
jgi:serine phosphatase RsbU (regulator of sigma subunit)/ligand-binding sensor domain-containing protein